MDWLDLPAVQGTLKSLLQHHSSKASILGRSAFFTVQLSHPCMIPGKIIIVLTAAAAAAKLLQSCPTLCDPTDGSPPGFPFPGILHAKTRWTIVGKEMSMHFNMLSRLVTTFLPWSKCLLISWLQSPSAVILEPRKIKSALFPLFPHLFAMK